MKQVIALISILLILSCSKAKPRPLETRIDIDLGVNNYEHLTIHAYTPKGVDFRWVAAEDRITLIITGESNPYPISFYWKGYDFYGTESHRIFSSQIKKAFNSAKKAIDAKDLRKRQL